MSKYTAQFMTQVAKEAQQTRTYAEVSRKYGIERKYVKSWAEKYTKYGELAFVENGIATFNEQRIHNLEKQIAELEEENAILKKATAFFSKKNL